MKVKPADLSAPSNRDHTAGELFWLITNGIPEVEMPGFKGDLDERSRWALAAYLPSLAAPDAAAEHAVTLRFRATVGGTPFSCSSTYPGHGTQKSTVAPLDFRFFVHDVRLVRKDGREDAVRLRNDGRWQDGEVALLDFEDGSGTCANGTGETRVVIEGTAPSGDVAGVKFTLGVPFAKNHGEPVKQAPPLDMTRMFWVWNAGYKFARIDMKADDKNFFIHLGSSNCSPGDTAQTVPTTCEHPNRVDVRLDGFNPDRDVVEADLARLLAGSNLIENQPKTAAGCMSGPDDRDCAPIFRAFGLPFGGAKAPDRQTFLQTAPRAVDYAWTLPKGFPVPRVPPGNPMSEAKVELGRLLFYDGRLSVTQRHSCASCHEQALAFTDGKARGIGATGEAHPRSSMSLVNVAYAPVLTWANPNQTSLETQALVPMFGETPVELGLAGREKEVLARLAQDRDYPELFRRAFPEDPSPLSIANITRAVASFERTLISGNAPYDRYSLGTDRQAIPDSAKRGEALFFSERLECFHCHGGFNFTQTADYAGRAAPEIEFHNTGLYNVDGHGGYPAPNTGVREVTGRLEDMGRFKAPTLRNIAVTAPYMHDGSVATLEDAIAHYAQGGRAMGGKGTTSPLKSGFVKGFTLSAEEAGDLVAFLRSLTDREFLDDPRFKDPRAAVTPRRAQR